MTAKFFETSMDYESTSQKGNLYEEEMAPIPPTLLELYEHDQETFINLIMNRKKHWGLLDVTKSLDEDFTKALDMISYIVSRFPQSLTEREVYFILMKTSNPKEFPVLHYQILEKMEKMLKNPRYKSDIRTLRKKNYFNVLSQNLISIFQ
jgi:hypothetical protein